MKSFKNGFSLIEMLVAVILVSLLIGVAIFSFKYQLIAISKSKKIGFSKVLNYKQLKSSIESIKYYVVDDYDTLNLPMKKLHHYFNGSKNRINFITTSGLFSIKTVVAELMCREGKLFYKEEELYNRIDFLKPKVLEDSQKKIFYSNLDKCYFSYIYNEKEIDQINDKIPGMIKIHLSFNEDEKEYYINIQSDYNISLGVIEDAIYPVD